ncbi:c-type cytochrome [Rhizobium rhizosphaerae]|uniref:c-type cytochrome n=1 Tax=Xaviernesmea rhizosphaerae TaxID=1672749 RepID=UPI000ADA1605|nr:cytochrome c family protein [Xaviernesmea rhizosphaerae]
MIRLPVLALFASLLIAPVTAAQDAAHGRQVFNACTSCHTVTSERHTFGPSLKGVVGRGIGTAPDYRYSDVMHQAGADGKIWDEATLSTFLANPSKVMPGTKMRFWGLWTDAEIKDVIAYLAAHP